MSQIQTADDKVATVKRIDHKEAFNLLAALLYKKWRRDFLKNSVAFTHDLTEVPVWYPFGYYEPSDFVSLIGDGRFLWLEIKKDCWIGKKNEVVTFAL